MAPPAARPAGVVEDGRQNAGRDPGAIAKRDRPLNGGLTLRHCETDVEPECSVGFGTMISPTRAGSSSSSRGAITPASAPFGYGEH